MSILLFLIPLSVLLATGFLLAFIWAIRSGQYDDTCTPAMRLLVEDEDNGPQPTKPEPKNFERMEVKKS